MVTATETQVAGRELDALVAERVMGLCVHIPERVPPDVIAASRREDFKAEYGQEPPESWDGDAYSEYEWDHDHWPWRCKKCGERCNARVRLADYSTDIRAAWRLVEHLSILYRVEVYELDSGWVCKLTTRDTMPAISLDGKQTRMYHGELGGGGSGLAPKTTAPFAICQAALKAAEYERRGNH